MHEGGRGRESRGCAPQSQGIMTDAQGRVNTRLAYATTKRSRRASSASA